MKPKAAAAWRTNICEELEDIRSQLNDISYSNVALRKAVYELENKKPRRLTLRPFWAGNGTVLTAGVLVRLVVAWATLLTAAGITFDHLVVR